LSGGEIPAMAVADAVARLIPGVLGNQESLISESFSSASLTPHSLLPAHILDFPHYTQPAEYKGWKVPEILRSGNHAEIQKWREEKVKKKVS
jgi:tRNA (guanine37-N1)-methyltransferase